MSDEKANELHPRDILRAERERNANY